MGYIYNYEELEQRLEITPARVAEAENKSSNNSASPKHRSACQQLW
jgi:hypothetical protein